MTAVTGGLGLAQVLTAFFGRPIRELQSNLNNLAGFKMILETHSLKTAFTRYHLTTPEVLRELGDPVDRDAALGQIEALKQQLRLIDDAQSNEYGALGQVVRARRSDGPAPDPGADGADTGAAGATASSSP